MNFTINNQPYTFTVLVDQGVLTDFTATNGDTVYDCSIQLISRDEVAQILCCTPVTCTEGPCRMPQTVAQSA